MHLVVSLLKFSTSDFVIKTRKDYHQNYCHTINMQNGIVMMSEVLKFGNCCPSFGWNMLVMM